MEQKAFLFTSIPLIGIILIFGYLNVQQNATFEKNAYSYKCQDIEINSVEGIDILFISSVEEAKYYSEYLFSVEPYKTYRPYFNIRVIPQEVTCDNYQGIAMLCYNKEVLDVASRCEHDYVVVIKEDSKQIRSSAYGKVLSINKAHEDSVLVHEFGHLFNLAEEYGGAKIPKGSKNCQKSCDSFDGPIDSCSQECSESTHYRSIPLGVMRSLVTDNYGIYDTALITEVLERNKPKETKITGNQISEVIDCNQNILELEVKGSKIESKNILSKGCFPDKGVAGPICVGDVCNINTLFTDSQDILVEDTLSGETYLDPQIPLIFYVKPDKTQPYIDITLDGEIIGTINTAEAGATACRI